jgi:hypothetical protein
MPLDCPSCGGFGGGCQNCNFSGKSPPAACPECGRCVDKTKALAMYRHNVSGKRGAARCGGSGRTVEQMTKLKGIVDAAMTKPDPVGRLRAACEKAIAVLTTETACRAKCEECKVTDAISDLRVALHLSDVRS